MDIDRFKDIIQHRIYVEDISQGEWYDEMEKCWKEEIKVLTEDLPGTMAYLKDACTADEYSWISEVLEDIAEQTKSKELISCYKSLMAKFPDECVKYNIAGTIKNAEDILACDGVQNEKEKESCR